MPMFRYFSSFILIFCTSLLTSAQEQSTTKDTINYNEKYGIRVGIDISKPIRSVVHDNYSGIEIVGDYRFYDNFYVSAELGNEKITFEGDNIQTLSNGSYIKLGGDYNAYENWLDMQNVIFVGVRYGFATFSQTLEEYTIYTATDYYGVNTNTEDIESTGLTASWAEVMVGIKVEIINNLYLSANVQLKRRISQSEPNNLDNLAIPGFGRTYDASEFGAGFGYSISYMIPFYKKARN